MTQGESGRGWAGLMTAGAASAAVALALVALAHAESARSSSLVSPMPSRLKRPIVVPVEAFQKTTTTSKASSTVLLKGSRRVVVSIPERKLALVADGRIAKVYRVAVGAKVSPSPRGEFRIVVRIPEATYYHAGVVIPSGEQSPIGTRWIGLDRAGYGIHGTNAPGSIGKAASHGCIRLRNRDAEELFELVRVGDVVEIRDEEVAQLVAANEDGSSGGE